MSLQLDYKRFHRRARYLANKWKVKLDLELNCLHVD